MVRITPVTPIPVTLPHIRVPEPTIKTLVSREPFKYGTETIYVGYDIRPSNDIHVNQVIAESRGNALDRVMSSIAPSVQPSVVLRSIAYTAEAARESASRAISSGNYLV